MDRGIQKKESKCMTTSVFGKKRRSSKKRKLREHTNYPTLSE